MNPIRIKMQYFRRDLFLFLSIATSVCSGSLYDPHLFPNQGPFFEGWYMRFLDSSKDLSFGVLFGRVLPENAQLAKKTWFMGIIIDGADNKPPSGRLLDYDCFPDPEKASLTVKEGQSIAEDPDISSPANFEFETGSCGSLKVKPSHSEVDVMVNNVKISATIGKPLMWASDGRGPMGWLNSFPLPLFWFVYSTGSVANYSITLPSGSEISGSALVHMEKNWGSSFPPSWLWLHGIKNPKNPSAGVGLNPGPATQNTESQTNDLISYAVTYGAVNFYVLDVPSHLAGYRNKAKNIQIDFRPDNSYSSVTRDPCGGQTALTFTSTLNKMEVISTANMSTFSKCLFGPMQNGFRQVCKESFQANTIVNIYRRNWFSWDLVDEQTFSLSALEFGGAFSCRGECIGEL